MDSSEIEKLLEPISPESPCGLDLEYDAQFGELERAAQEKAEQQFGSTIVGAETADWKAVRKHALGLLERTKDMRVVIYLARSSLNLEGLPGFQSALQLLRGYVENFWDSVHPELDHDDNDDPTYRTNTLITLCDEQTTLRELREAPLVSSRALGQFSLRDIEHAREASEPAEASSASSGAWADESSEGGADSADSGPTMATIEAAFTDASIEELQATEAAARLSAEHVAVIEQLVTEHVGVSQAVSLSAAQQILQEMSTIVEAQLQRRGIYTNAPEAADEAGEGEVAASGSEGSAGDAVVGSGGAASASANGQINSRDDVVRMLDRICEFYQRHEPSSPVPMLIRRARRLATMDFLQILRDLAPDGVPQAEIWGGVSEGGADAAQASAEDEGSSSTW
ncbi:MAG: type VI secretion system protein TssA [Planctomycetales bacterium]|nr:type VI secretion system protein TssA [Planctomycetales bacterium]